MPYPIPDNLDDIEGWRWYLVPLPDDDQMIRIAWGMWSELTKYWMWGEEGPVPDDSDKAAQLWSDALYEAWRVRDMGFPDDILTYIDDIETLLTQIRSVTGCCDNIGPIGDSEVWAGDYPGTAPATWGDGETVADSADWEQLVCGAAHAYVDHLKNMNNSMEDLVSGGLLVIGAVAGLLGLLTGAGLLAAVAWGTAASVVTGLIAGASSSTFSGVDADIETARNSIVCAIADGAGSASALSAAVQAAIPALPWTLFYSFVDYETAYNTMLTGSLGDLNLPVSRRTDCDCLDPLTDYHAVWPDFSTNMQYIQCIGGSDAFCTSDADTQKANPNQSFCGGESILGPSTSQIVGQDGGTVPPGAHNRADIVRVRFEYTLGSASSLAPFFRINTVASGDVDYPLESGPGFHSVEIDPTDGVVAYGGGTVRTFFRIPAAGSNDLNNQCCLSRVEIFMNTFEA